MSDLGNRLERDAPSAIPRYDIPNDQSDPTRFGARDALRAYAMV
jgi:hypothetical protein